MQSERVEHEGEVAVVIGRIAKHVAEADAANVIFGYTIANDVTARDLQQRDGQWTRAKGFDTFCPLGPVIDTELDLEGGTIETSVNGERRQEGHLADMVHSIPAIIAYASSVFTLLPGDVILTGTPAGVGPDRRRRHRRGHGLGPRHAVEPGARRALSGGGDGRSELGGRPPRYAGCRGIRSLSDRASSRRGRRPRRRSRGGTRPARARRGPRR